MNLVPIVGHFYAHGFPIVWTNLWIPVAGIFTKFSLVPLFYRLRISTVFQYLRLRFDNKVGIAACTIYFILTQTLGAVGIYSAATAVSTVFSVPLVYTNILIGLAGTTYTALGGLRSVVWADCIQAAVMIASPVTIIAKVIYDSSGVSPPLRPMADFNVNQYLVGGHFVMSSDDNTWTVLAASAPYALLRASFDHMAVQRFMAARTLSDAQWIAAKGALYLALVFALIALAALALIYWYRDCDPLLYGAITSYDQIVPLYMRESLSDITMLRGLFLAGHVSASTSTVSSVINSHAATFYTDIIAPFVKIDERKSVILIRILAFASGGLMTVYAIFVPFIGSATPLFVSLFCSGSGPFSGLILLAMSSPWVNAKAASWACLLVCGLQLWHGLGRKLSGFTASPFLYGTLDRCPALTSNNTFLALHSSLRQSQNVFPLYKLSFFWISLAGAVLTILLGNLFSLATGGFKTTSENLHLTSSFFLQIWRRVDFLRRRLQARFRKICIILTKQPAKLAPQMSWREATTNAPPSDISFGLFRQHKTVPIALLLKMT
ncbi:putative sodium-dependent multivitamin transporter [Amblyomma americanum]